MTALCSLLIDDEVGCYPLFLRSPGRSYGIHDSQSMGVPTTGGEKLGAQLATANQAAITYPFLPLKNAIHTLLSGA